jgi:hypothetical protein
VVVQGRADPQREILDVESVAGHLLPAGGVFEFLAGHRRELFPDELFADLFPSRRGRPSIPADVVASVIVLQTLHGLSDSEAVEAVTFDLRWKAACGLAVTAPGFHPTVLTYWRRRLAASARPRRIFEVVGQVVDQTGVLAGKTRRALGSTVLDDAVATQDTVTQLIAAIRRVARDVPGAAAVIAEHCSGHDYRDPGKPAIAWDDPDARARLVDALVGDAHRLLGHLPDAELDARPAEAMALLALVAGQDVEPAEGSDGTDGRWRIARKVAPERVISTVDPQTRHAHKTRARHQDGYQAQVKVEPDTGLITGCALTPAAGAAALRRRGRHRAADRRTRPDPGAGRFGLRHRRAAGRGRRGRAHRDHQTVAAAPGRGRRVHPRRFHRRRGGRHGDLPERADRPDHPHPQSDLRGALPRLPTTGPLHQLYPRPQAGPASARRAAPRAPGPRPGSRVPGRLPRAPAHGRTVDLLAGRRPQPAAAVRRDTPRNDLWLHHRAAALNLRRLLALGLTRTGGTWAVSTA